MTSTISVEARMIPKESMAKVFDAFVKIGEVRNIEICKEFIQVIQKTAPEQLDDKLSKIRRTIKKCLSTVKKMRNPCRGCVEGLLNQEGHYGGCIDEEVFKWYEEW